ncbi:MAG: MraY family glycosyltransferase [candidate division Zixibacteria bacterium]
MNWFDLAKIFAVAAAVTAILVPVISRLCFRLGLLDMPGQHKRHRFPTPNLGGLAIFVGFCAAVIYSNIQFHFLSEELSGILNYVVAGGVLIFLIGIVDDISGLSAPVKLTGQVIAGLIVYLGGLKISILFIPLYGAIELNGWALPVTLIWIVGVTNCINLIDGLDGLAAGVSAIAALAILFIGIVFSLSSVMVFSIGIMGSCLAFLYFNHYPAKIFMGDSGSLFLGYLFAIISIIFPIKSYTTAAVFIPLIALAVPIIETLISFTRRVATGKSFYRADTRHLFHYLTAYGFSKSKVVWLFYLTSSVFAILSGAMIIFDKRLVTTILVIFMVVIFAILFRFRLAYNKKLTEDE